MDASLDGRFQPIFAVALLQESGFREQNDPEIGDGSISPHGFDFLGLSILFFKRLGVRAILLQEQ